MDAFAADVADGYREGVRLGQRRRDPLDVRGKYARPVSVTARVSGRPFLNGLRVVEEDLWVGLLPDQQDRLPGRGVGVVSGST